MIELVHIDWPTRNALGDLQRSDIANKDSAGFQFRLIVTGAPPDILQVVQWWEHYLGPISMLQSIEIIP